MQQFATNLRAASVEDDIPQDAQTPDQQRPTPEVVTLEIQDVAHVSETPKVGD